MILKNSLVFIFLFILCIRVIDGDTIVIEGGEKIRLIGVDTPELHHPKKPVQYYAKEAKKFTKSLVEEKDVQLEYDRQRKDKYGRTLAYVYLKDRTFLNIEIIKQGYGFAYTKFPFKYLIKFKEYEKEAREQKKGLWGKKGKRIKPLTLYIEYKNHAKKRLLKIKLFFVFFPLDKK